LAWQFRHGESLYFPMATWRVDAVVLMILAAAVLPAAAGRWRPGRGDGAMLLVIYIGYVLASIVISVMV
jgi:Ca2+/Na+ antiporter